jgi:ketosteroid isomerase-like protein
MSQENVKIVRRNFELWSEGADDELAHRLAPDVEWRHNIGAGTPLEGIYRGRAEVLELFDAIRDSFGVARFELEELRRPVPNRGPRSRPASSGGQRQRRGGKYALRSRGGGHRWTRDTAAVLDRPEQRPRSRRAAGVGRASRPHAASSPPPSSRRKNSASRWPWCRVAGRGVRCAAPPDRRSQPGRLPRMLQPPGHVGLALARLTLVVVALPASST